MSYRTHASGSALAAGLLALLSGCGSDNSCYNCGVPPYEISLGVVAGDFNGNGLPSLVALNAVQPALSLVPDNLKVYLSTGAGALAPPAYVADGTAPLYVAGADLNHDGLPDAVSASFADGALAVFFNNKGSPGTFGVPLVLPSPGASQLAIADMNHDGLPDLVSADYGVSLFLQTSPGVFAAPVSLYPGGANWVALGDLNGDGATDVALTDNVGVKVLMHVGAPSSVTYAAPVSVYTQSANAYLLGANLIAIADVNGDGANDLVITDPGSGGGLVPTVNILLQNTAVPGTFLAPASYPIASQDIAQSIVVTDLDGDGRPDIVIGGQQTVTVLLQNHAPLARGTYMPAAVYSAPGANEIAVADINADGRPDIVVSTGPSSPVVNGVATVNPGVLLQSASSPGTFGAVQNLP